MNKFYKGVLLILLSAAGYGIMPIFAKFAYAGGVTVSTLLSVRFSLAAGFLFVYIFLNKKKIQVTRLEIFWMFVLGGMCYTLQSTLFFNAIKFISVPLTELILFINPVMVAVLAFFIDKEKLKIKVLCSIAVSFLGLIFALGASMDKVDLRGIVLAFGAAIVYSIYIILGNKLVKNTSPIIMSAFISLFTALSLSAWGFSTHSIKFDFYVSSWFPIAGLVLISTVVSILAFFKAIELIGPLKTSVIGMMEPVFAVAASVIFLDEKLGFIQGLGGAAVLLGAFLVILSQKSNKT